MRTAKSHCRKIIPAVFMTLALIGLGSLTSHAATKGGTANSSIVGLWNVHYFQGESELFQTYDQLDSDGLEFEVNSIFPGAVCQGAWSQIARNRVSLFHVIWTFDASGVLTGHIEETQTNTASRNSNTYQGTFDQKVYDLNGNLVGELTGPLQATRLPASESRKC